MSTKYCFEQTGFKFIGAQKICVQHLQENLKISNCLGVWLMAEQYVIQNLAKRALEMALWNFKKVVKEREFYYMNLKPLVTFLSNDDINAHSEETIFEAMLSWIQFKDHKDRYISFPVLIRTVRLNNLKISVSSTLSSALGRSLQAH